MRVGGMGVLAVWVMGARWERWGRVIMGLTERERSDRGSGVGSREQERKRWG